MHGGLPAENPARTIRFMAAGAEYRGRVNANTIEGTVKSAGKSTDWKASR